MSDRREEFIALCDTKLRLVRAEANLTQEDMSYALGISKKTLVDIEKGRRTLGWTGAVALCSVFRDSDILASAFGGPTVDMVQALALQGRTLPAPEPTGNPWWTVIAENPAYIIEQNVISQHYRLLTRDRTRVTSSFDIDDLIPQFNAQPKE
ncbi:MAG: helix-turn-helix domain-containing protein [Propionibacteriaceae bacterium]|jgi:DNA-binding XRE family transcriptional regulator|nr:helix-turn-helix domain-containing protein [Propionibacteriaceae bacterium]